MQSMVARYCHLLVRKRYRKVLKYPAEDDMN